MTNIHYQRAAGQERRLATKLRMLGYDVHRNAGSHGWCDLIATRDAQTYAIEVKRDRHKMPLVSWHTLWTRANAHGWVPVIADFDGLWQLTADKPPHALIDDHLENITSAVLIGWPTD